MKKQYKALMLDLDGTTIPNDPKGMPSEKVIQAISSASEKIYVGVCTGRPYYFTKKVINQLNLNAPSIYGGGSKIVDGEGKVVWEAPLLADDVAFIHALLKERDMRSLSEGENNEWTEKDVEIILKQKIYGIAGRDLSSSQADTFIDALKNHETINAHKVVGWKEGTFWVQITHSSASKQHGILKVAELLNLETHEFIGVGEGYNDFPLLMACGLKVAMGNAVPELKAIADYIAPTVDEDGVVDVIEKFVL